MIRVIVKSKTGVLNNILVRPFDIKKGAVLMYYPEVNSLISQSVDPLSRTPGLNLQSLLFKRVVHKMFQKILTWFIQLTPGMKRWFWKWWYNAFAKRAQDDTFKFMNYGYHADGFNPPLQESDENERYPIHLYHHVATQIDITDKAVLEIGSGRGGGASYLTRYLNPIVLCWNRYF